MFVPHIFAHNSPPRALRLKAALCLKRMSELDCNCEDYPSVFEESALDATVIFQMPRIDKEKPPKHNGYYMANKQCPQCKQVWRVPRRKSQRTDRLYFKVPREINHLEYDEIDLRIEYVRIKHGVSSEVTCNWSGCEENALNKMVFCAFHAYHGPGVRR